MARPKEKTSSAFNQSCVAAVDKLASSQAGRLKDDIQRLFTEELLADLSVDIGYREVALHKCILKARSADFYNYIISLQRIGSSRAYSVSNAHFTDIENCLGSLYTDDEISATIEKLHRYFHPEVSVELEQHNTDNTIGADTNVIDSRQENVTGEDLHVISENITNTSLDLVKNDSSLSRNLCNGTCKVSVVESEEYLSSCDGAKCDTKSNGSKQDVSDAGDKTEKETETSGKILNVGDKMVEECCCGQESVEENVYMLAERIVEQVIIEAQNIVANNNVDKGENEKKSEDAKESKSVIKCNGDVKLDKRAEVDTSICNLDKPAEKQTYETNGVETCLGNKAGKSKESIQRLQERVYGVKTLMKPCSELGEDLVRMLLEKECTDCTIEVQGEIFPAHRCILAARSSYFEAMLGGSWRESEEENIVLEGVVPSVLKQTLLYLYGGVIQVDPQCTLGGLIMMADMYGMEGLKEVVALNLNIEYCHFFHRPCPECIAGVPEALALTMMYNMESLKEKCVKWINKHFGRVWAAKSLATLPQEVLEFTVSSAIKDLALSNVLDILTDCQRLNEKTPHLKWTEPVFDMITQLMDAAIEFASQNFIALISGNTFKKIDKEGIAFNKQPLEDIFGMIIQALSPENACLAYLNLNRWIKSAEATAEDQKPLYSEEFVDFVSVLFSKCKKHLCLYIHQAANTAEWELLSKHMQETILQEANYVCIDTNRGRMARPKLTSMQKKISATSPLSLKEYFECHFGQAKPQMRNLKSRKDNPQETKSGKSLALSRETTKGAKDKCLPRSADHRKVSAEMSSVKTVKHFRKDANKNETVSACGKKGTRGKPNTVSEDFMCQNLENFGTGDKKLNNSNTLSSDMSLSMASFNEKGYEYRMNTELFDLQATGDIELIEMAPGVVFYEEKPLPVFVVDFFRPEQLF